MSLFGSTPASVSSTTSQVLGTAADLQSDRDLTSPPEDSVSSLSFSPQAEILAVGSWDKKVRIYEIAPNGDSQGKALYEQPGAVLSVHWSSVGVEKWCDI